MKIIDNESKIDLIKRFYKKEKIYLEMKLINYEESNLYIILTYNKSNDSYKLRWFKLDQIIDKDIEKYMSCTYISNKVIDIIEEDFSKFKVSSKFEDTLVTNEDIVELKAYIRTEIEDEVNIKFKKYMPKKLNHLISLFIFIFRNISSEYEPILYEILAQFTDTTEKYEYKKEFEFDLFNGNVEKLFNYQITQRGIDYYGDSRVKFLEKIDDRYFAVVEGNEKYLVIIKYDEKLKRMKLFCSCPCEFYCKHMCAVILAIREKDFNRFYKIKYKNINKDLLERIIEFNYSLCLGVIGKNFEIINNYGEIELVPIIDENNDYNWEVLEDSEDEYLINQIKMVLEER